MTMMPAYVIRFLNLSKTLERKSCFLFGPRQTGKTTLIEHSLKPDFSYNLLANEVFLMFSQSPQRLREEVTKEGALIFIDEIQKLPLLLDEVHLLIEKKRARFLLTGSSARKLRRGGINLLGGRARHRTLHPFIYPELKEKFNLLRALNYGLIPSIYFSDSPNEDLGSYIGDYLKEEIAHEGFSRNIPAFSRFLEIAALCNGQLVNYTNISNDAQVPRTTVHEYFHILKDTLIGYEITPWKKTKKRKALSTNKFYFFDTGITRYLQKFNSILEKSPAFGPLFENYIFHELQSYCDYLQNGVLNHWRSKSGFEVDFILNDSIAIEAKGKMNITDKDLRGLRALEEEKAIKNYYVVSLEKNERKIGKIRILPWKLFLQMLWEKSL